MRRFLSLLLLALSLSTAAQANSILALYKGSEEPIVMGTRIAIKVQPLLPDYQFRFHDIEKGFPESVPEGVVMTWFGSPQIADPKAYVSWLDSQRRAGKKVVILGNFGAHTSDGQTWMTNEALNQFFYPFGLDYRAAYTNKPELLQVVQSQPPAAPPSPLNYYLLFRSVLPQNRVLLSVKRTDLQASESALAVITPHGAVAQETYVDAIQMEPFLRAALEDAINPIQSRGRILGLYKSSEGVDETTNFLTRFGRAALLDLGYDLEMYDILQGFPNDERMKNFSAIVSWFNGPEMSQAGDYAVWLARQLEEGRKVVVLGNYGAFAEDIDSKAGTVRRYLLPKEYNRFFFPFGLEFRGAWTPDRSKVSVVKKDAQMIPWLPADKVGHYYWIKSIDEGNRDYLVVSRQDIDEGEASVVVATPHGGLALESYVFQSVPGALDPKFHLDLKKFLQVCLGDEIVSRRTQEATLEPTPRQPRPALAPVTIPFTHPPGIEPIRRRVLVFYEKSRKESPTENSVYHKAETVLNYLGLMVDYRAVEEPLPTAAEMEPYLGVLTWFGSRAVQKAGAFDLWIRQQLKAGKKVVVMGDYPAYDAKDLSPIDVGPTLAMMSLDYVPLSSKPTLNQYDQFRRGGTGSVVQSDPTMMGFERELNWADKDLGTDWTQVKARDKNLKVYLTIRRQGQDSDIVMTHPQGGLALGPFPTYDQKNSNKKLVEAVAKPGGKPVAEDINPTPWRLNPFLFFSQAFGLDRFPAPDVTTLNGLRYYYSHIDGDAFGGLSHTDYSSLNGEVMEKRVLRSLGLPITVSYVTRDIESKLDPRYSRELDTARRIFELPNVEPASHTYSHPFEWRLGDISVADQGGSTIQIVRKPVDLDQQLNHSIDFIERFLAPANKRCEILLWSGRCNPDAPAIERTRRLGVANMNGGESVFDQKNPFVAGIKPLFAQVGSEFQYHVSAAGDFYYTSSWTGNYDGMKNLVDYFQKTESPRRLRAMNIYYHFYLAEKEAGLQGLDVAYTFVKSKPLAPVFASDYVKVLKGFLTAQTGRTQDGRLWVGNTGRLQTIRVDGGQAVDLSRSQGVLGYSATNGSLYVHLDENEEHVIALAEAPTPGLRLEHFSHRLEQWKATPEQIRFRAFGQGPATLSLAGLPSGVGYRIEVQSSESPHQSEVRIDDRGTLRWRGSLAGYKGHHDFIIRRIP